MDWFLYDRDLRHESVNSCNILLVTIKARKKDHNDRFCEKLLFCVHSTVTLNILQKVVKSVESFQHKIEVCHRLKYKDSARAETSTKPTFSNLLVPP